MRADSTNCLDMRGFEASGGGTGIRTPEGREPLLVFKTSAFNHSAIPPSASVITTQYQFGEYLSYESRIKFLNRVMQPTYLPDR
jgi:hypothetical protein